MATQLFSRSLPKTLILTSMFSRSFLTANRAAISASSCSSSSLLRYLRPLTAIVGADFRSVSPAPSVREFATRATSSSLNDPNPNWSNRPPKETILLDGCDFEHWLVVMEKPEGDPTRDEIIDSYIKTLAMVIGSEEEARMKIYSVSTRCYFAFGCLVSEELSYKIKELPKVRWVLPDSYLDVKNKDYGGEPFINGQAVPYDPKYHEEWIRNNARANERNKRNDRPRNFDRSRNFERRRENMQSREFPNASPNQPTGPNMSPPAPSNMPPNNFNAGMPPQNRGGMPQGNYAGGPPPPPPNNFSGPPPPHNYAGGPPPPPPNNFGGPPPPPLNNYAGQPPRNYAPPPPPPPHSGPAPPHFDLDTVIQAKIRPLSVVQRKSFIGFFHPEGINEARFEFLHGAMSFDNIWDEISRTVTDCPDDSEPQVYVVSWNDHFFILKVESDAYYIIDTLGERLYEGCNQAYILKFDNNTTICKMPDTNQSAGEKTSNDQQTVAEIVEAKEQQASGKEESLTLENVASQPEEPMKEKDEVLCRGKESCKEYIKSFLAAIPIRELQADIKKGLMASTPLHHRLQIELNYTQILQPSPDSSHASEDPNTMPQSPDATLLADIAATS